jgi:hypothetical protein
MRSSVRVGVYRRPGMTEPPGVQPALGIESVEWFAAGGERLIVRVTGRWLRRPAAPRGHAMLVVAADTQRHRFPAMPEPPSIGGTPPGAWRVSFSLPAWLAPYLSRRLSLQIGGVIVPLPGARSVNPEGADGEQTVLDAPEYAEHGFALGVEPQPDELSDTEARVRELEREVAALRRDAENPEPDEPRPASWGEVEPLGSIERSSPAEPITGALRQEIELARGVPPAQPSPPAPESSESRGLSAEREMLAARPRRPHPVVPSTSAPGDDAGEPDELRRTLADVSSQLELRSESEALLVSTVAALRRELHARTATEAHVRAQLATVQGSLDARTATQSALEATLGELRQELTELRRADDREMAAQADAEARALALARQLSELGSQLADMRSQLATLGGERDAAEAESVALRTEISTLRSELSAAQEVSRRDAVALARAEALLAEAHGLAADAEERLAAEHRRAQEAVAAREQVEREFAEYRERSVRVHKAIEELRQQLAAMRGTRAAVAPPETEIQAAPSAEAEPAPSAEAAPAPPSMLGEAEAADPTGAVEPERLTEALSRLRENAPAPEAPEAGVPALEASEGAPEAPEAGVPAPEAPEGAPEADSPAPEGDAPAPEAPAAPPVATQSEAGKPKRSRKAWLRPALRSLTAQDPETAGQIIVELLPAQRAADPRKVSYDLVLGEHDCVLVTVRDQVEIERRPAPRELADVDFRLTGDVASVARLVTAGRLRRTLRRRLPKIGGDRAAVAPLRALGRAQLDLRELHAAGVRLDAPLLLRLAASTVKPSWTYDDRFTIAHELGSGHEMTTYLNVRGGGSPSVSSAPASPVTTTIVCSAESLLLLLAGERPDGVEVRGDEQPLVRLQSWIERAQSG